MARPKRVLPLARKLQKAHPRVPLPVAWLARQRGRLQVVRPQKPKLQRHPPLVADVQKLARLLGKVV